VNTSALSTSEQALWRALTLLGRRLAAGLEQRLQADAGISGPDFEILTALDGADQGRLRAGSLGEMLGWEKSRTSHHVARMEGRGLVRRVHCAEDHRGTWVELGPAGREALELAQPSFDAHVRGALVDVLPEDEAYVVARAAVRLLHVSPASSCTAEIERLGAELGLDTAVAR